MRLVTYDRGGARRLGAWVGEAVVDLPAVVGHPAFPTTMEALVAHRGGTTLVAAMDAIGHPEYLRGCTVGRPRLLTPIVPISLLEHRRVLGPDEPVPWPAWADELDYQVELACIIGEYARDVSAEEAMSVIFGYTLMNDWTAREARDGDSLMGGAGRPSLGRVERFATSLGPSVVTPDEFDPTQGKLTARVGGEIWSVGDLGQARTTFPDLIAELSRDRELFPGDVVGSGTFPGGCALDLGRRICPGVTVELEARTIGVLRNRAAKGPSGPRPGPRTVRRPHDPAPAP